MYTPSALVERLRANSLRPATVQNEAADVVVLSSGDPDFPTPALIFDAAIEAMREGHTRYGDLRGDPELREQVARNTSAV